MAKKIQLELEGRKIKENRALEEAAQK